MDMDESRLFEEIWSRYAERPNVSPALKSLVRDLYSSLVGDGVDLPRIRDAVDRVLAFLASPAGRTDANCVAVDHFLCLGEFDWPDVPAPLHDVLADMAGALHDTVSNPKVAANFDSTPEQLLARLRHAEIE